MCNAYTEQIEQIPMRAPPKPKKSKSGQVAEKPFVFELPLEKPICNNTGKLSERIATKNQHLSKKILI
jgi:hypothetical protein